MLPPSTVADLKALVFYISVDYQVFISPFVLSVTPSYFTVEGMVTCCIFKYQSTKMSIRKTPDYSVQKELLQKAQRAADAGDYIGMLEGLAGSMLFEAFRGYFAKKYPAVDSNDVYDCIGSATDELWTRIATGEKIRKIESYLWKIVDRKLSEFVEERRGWSSGDALELIGTNGGSTDTKDFQKQKEESREQVLRIFEDLIPRLGMVNVQEVMKYILGAIRNGVQDITSNEIAEALGLKSENIRQSMKRGFDRLARIVKEENLVDKNHRFAFLDEVEYYVEHDSGGGDD